MPRTKKIKKPTSGLIRPVLIIAGILLIVYVLMAYLVMPTYTRHWQRVNVPDVTNLSLVAAEKIIKHHNLEPMRGEVKFDDVMPAGFVSFQNPIGGANVKKGRRIYLTFSKGKRPVVVPNLVGLNVRDARFAIEQNQLTLGKVTYDFDRYYPEDVVMAQAIEPGIEIIMGSVLDITVSTGEEPLEVYVPNLYGRTLDEAELLIKKSRLMKGQVNYRESNESAPHLIIYQSIEAGRRAAIGDTIDLELSKAPNSAEDNSPW